VHRAEEDYHAEPRHPPPRAPQTVAVSKTGRANYTTLEDVSEGEHILASMFSLHGRPIIILFDSGATHDFISRDCTQKHHLGIQHSDSPYMISTPGGRMTTKHNVPKTPLNLGGRVFKVCLIILDGQGIDVILGMSWMKMHKTLLDTTT
jgi:predicted aspartyl protease